MTGLPDEVQQAPHSLRAGEWTRAREHVELALERVTDPALLARLHGWHAQTLFELGDLLPARTAVQQALLAARQLDGEQPLGPLKTLHGRITGGLAAESAARQHKATAVALAERPLEDLLSQAGGPTARANVYLARADALVDVGRLSEVPGLVAAGLQEAPSDAVRERVLLRLAHLRLRPPEANNILLEALQIAQDADSHTLVGAVAKTARDLGLALPEHTF